MALRSLKTNKLRSTLTILIIALGITVLVGIITATEVLKNTVYSSFSSMGANSFQITSGFIKATNKRKNRYIGNANDYPITWNEAKLFKKQFLLPSVIAISARGTGTAKAQYGSLVTNPNISVLGVDNEYAVISDTKLELGRWFSNYEQEQGSKVAILGFAVASKLFKGKEGLAINKVINVGSKKFRVIGVAESKGGSMMMNANNLILIPIQTARAQYSPNDFVINVMVSNVSNKDLAAEEAEGLFRTIRKIPTGYSNNFSIRQNDDMANMVVDNIKYISWAALVIAVVTLLGSVIGLMNIMLVSVAERTREIGIAKALGAKSVTIRDQFLSESIVISLLGGLLGVVMGILLGNILGLALDSTFIIPWKWMFVGLVLCAIVGIVSGVYPAIQASKLNPINALRYE